LKKNTLHIKRFLSFALLWVFFIALTPWSALHHHAEVSYSCTNEPVCKHKLHIGTHQEQCLVCAAHFEKDYVSTWNYFQIYITNSIFLHSQPFHAEVYASSVAIAVRGPPIA
jgi:hypothetical protein